MIRRLPFLIWICRIAEGQKCRAIESSAVRVSKAIINAGHYLAFS